VGELPGYFNAAECRTAGLRGVGIYRDSLM
jgi:hypothetical protein